MAKKLGFALGAGGSRGVAHVGFLKAMDEEGIKPDYITGSSMGSVVGSCYSLGLTPDFIMKEITKLKMSDLFDLSINPFGNGAILRAQKMRKKLQNYLKDYTFNDTKIPFRTVAVDLVSGQAILFKGKDKLIDGVSASSSIPGVFKPVQIGDKMLVDGGVRTRLPIDEVKDMGADVVVTVDVLGGIRPKTKRYNIGSVIVRTSEIYDDEIVRLRLLLQKPDLYLAPELGDMSPFKFNGIKDAYEVGYKLGKEHAEEIKKLL